MNQISLCLTLPTKKMRKCEFLEEMDKVLPWTVLAHARPVVTTSVGMQGLDDRLAGGDGGGRNAATNGVGMRAAVHRRRVVAAKRVGGMAVDSNRAMSGAMWKAFADLRETA